MLNFWRELLILFDGFWFDFICVQLLRLSDNSKLLIPLNKYSKEKINKIINIKICQFYRVIS